MLLELGREEDDADALAEAQEQLAQAESRLEEAELRRLLGGEHDAGNAIVSINAGAGGTDACDWAEMLLRMYLRWARAARATRARSSTCQAGDEAGIRGVTFTVSGDYAYGYLKAEEGVHRLVRISPFDSQARRHTAFASVSVFPEIDDDDRDRDRRERPARRHLPRRRRRRPARQQDRLGGAPHAPADRHRGAVPERALASTRTAPRR